MTQPSTSPAAESETGAEEQARLIAEHAGIDMLDDHDLFIAEMAAALRQSAASAREKALEEAEGIAREADMNGLIDRIDRHRGHRIADAIAALGSSIPDRGEGK